MKKIICIILVAALMLGFIAMIVTNVAADVVDTVEITGVTAPVVGADPDGSAACSDPNVEVSATWYDGATRQPVEGKFQDNKVYVLEVFVSTEGDNWFDEYESVFTINGEAPYRVNRYWDTYFAVYQVYTLGDAQLYHEVEVLAIPELKVGDTMTVESLVAALKLGNDLKIDPEDCCLRELNEEDEDRALEDGEKLGKKRYVLEAAVQAPANGWVDPYEISVTGPGEVTGGWTDTTAYVHVYYELREAVKEISVSGVKLPAVGEKFTVEGITVTGATLDSAYWHDENGDPVTENTVLARDKMYYLGLNLTAPEGQYLVEDTVVTFNGKTEGETDRLSCYGDGETIWVDYTHSVDSPRVFSVQLKGVPEKVEPGAAPQVQLTTGNKKVNIKKATWMDLDQEPVTTFENGEAYVLQVEVEAKDGYLLRDYASMYTRKGYAYEYFVDDEGVLTGYFVYNLGKDIDDIQIKTTGITVGQEFSKVEAVLPEGVVQSYLNVYPMTGENTGKFEAGQTYRLELSIEPKEGYLFDLDAALSVDGKEPYGWWVDYGYANMEWLVTFGTAIDKVSISMMEIKEGGKVTAPTVAEDAKYQVDYWYCNESGQWVDMEEGDLFEAGESYSINVGLSPKDGYYFAEDMQILINGAPVKDSYYSSVNLEIYERGSLKEQVQKVELPAWPEAPQVGKAMPATQRFVSADGLYTVVGYWSDQGNNIYDGIAGEDCFYIFYYDIVAKDGYAFAQDTPVTVGDEAVGIINRDFYNGDDDSMRVYKNYAVGKELVDVIELTVEGEPVNGGKPGKVFVPDEENKNYYCKGEAYWAVSPDGDVMNAEQLEGNFANGNYYYLEIGLMADQGYAITQDTVVKINGKAADVEMIQYGEDVYLIVEYGKLGAEAGNPKTGDGMVLAAALVGMMAMGGMAITAISRKRAV